MKDHLSLNYGRGDRGSSIWCCTSPICLEVKGGLLENLMKYVIVEQWQFSFETYKFESGISIEEFIEKNFPEETFKVTLCEGLTGRERGYEFLDLEFLIPEHEVSFGFLFPAAYYESWDEIERSKTLGELWDPRDFGKG